MPNGYDQNWVRLCVTLDGFRSIHGRWPIRVRMATVSLRSLDDLFTPADLAIINAKVELIADERAAFLAEDDSGNTFNYGAGDKAGRLRKPSAAEWLGVKPTHDY